MGRLIYSTLASLDGYIADEDGRFDWAVPSAEVHAAVNARLHGVGTFLLGRRLYEVMRAWDAVDVRGQSPEVVEFAHIWRSADKIVYSRTLKSVPEPRTRLERHFEVDGVRRFVAAAGRDVAIGGPDLAAAAFRAAIVDDVVLHVFPVLIGAGTTAFPADVRLELELVGERRFENGVVGLEYRHARS